jgi:hypothetical protein
MTMIRKPLILHRETLRVLQPSDALSVQAGVGLTPLQPTGTGLILPRGPFSGGKMNICH